MPVWRRSVTSGLRWEAATVLVCVLLCAGPGRAGDGGGAPTRRIRTDHPDTDRAIGLGLEASPRSSVSKKAWLHSTESSKSRQGAATTTRAHI